MPPKKPAADSAESPSIEDPVEAKAEKKTDAVALRKLAAHPSTAIMVKEALKELDSRKGVSSQAIQNYIKQKYPSVDLVRLKHLVRRALKKGIENGTLVRPANSSVATGAMGKFRLAPKTKEPASKTKEPKPKNENVDPNMQKSPKPVKDGAKKPKKAGATKKDATKEQTPAQEDSKPPKKSKKAEGTATTKAASAKKPKAKAAAENYDGDGISTTKPEGDGEAVSDAPKTKAAKKTKVAKTGKATKSKVAKADSDAPASKATGKRGKKTAE